MTTQHQRFEKEVGFTHPYKGTKLYVKGGRAFYGRWRPIPVQLDGDEDTVIVREGQEGQLDLFADEAYGNRQLWRVIAQANKIDLPIEDVVPGMVLIIPKVANVNAALQATQARGASVSLSAET